jgi:hypothetical protein
MKIKGEKIMNNNAYKILNKTFKKTFTREEAHDFVKNHNKTIFLKDRKNSTPTQGQYLLQVKDKFFVYDNSVWTRENYLTVLDGKPSDYENFARI